MLNGRNLNHSKKKFFRKICILKIPFIKLLLPLSISTSILVSEYEQFYNIRVQIKNQNPRYIMSKTAQDKTKFL